MNLNYTDLMLSFFSDTEALAATGNLEDASRKLDELLRQQNAVKARALNDAGVIAFRRGDREKAQNLYQEAVKLAPEEISFRKNLADLLYFSFGDSETALAHYRQILAVSPGDFDACLAIGRICADLGRHFLSEAEEFFSLAEKASPGNPAVMAERKQLPHLLTSRETSPGGSATSGSELPENPETAYQQLTATISPEERPAEAETKLLEFCQRFPDFALAWNDLGVISFKLEKTQQSIQCYRKAVELAPRNITFRKNLADFLLVIEQNSQEAMFHYNEVLKIAPKDIETLLMIGRLCRENNAIEDAETFFNLVLEELRQKQTGETQGEPASASPKSSE